MLMNVSFRLTEARINRFAQAGVTSLSDLRRVLQAMDLDALIEIIDAEPVKHTAPLPVVETPKKGARK